MENKVVITHISKATTITLPYDWNKNNKLFIGCKEIQLKDYSSHRFIKRDGQIIMLEPLDTE